MRLRILAPALILMASANGAAAQESALPPVVLVNILVSRGQFAAASHVAENVGRQDSALWWLHDYVLANRLLAEGQPRAAEGRARQLLNDQPDQPDVRQLLVNVLIAQKKYRAAKYHIGKLNGAVGDEGVQKSYQEYLTAYLKTHKPYGVDVSFGATPSTNANRGSEVDAVDIGGLSFTLDDEARARGGVNLESSISAYYRLQVGESTDLLLRGSVNLSKNTNNTDDDLTTFILAPQLQHSFNSARFGIGPVVEYQLRGYEPYAVRYGLAGAIGLNLTPELTLLSQAKFVRQSYSDQTFRDGHKFSSHSSLRAPLSEGLTGAISAHFESERTQKAHLDSDLVGLGASLDRRWAGLDLTTSIGLEYAWQDFRGNYPLASYARRDERLTVSLSATSDRFRFLGSTPTVGYEYIENSSNISFKSYSSHNLILGTKRSF